jgi:hypothetical protein
VEVIWCVPSSGDKGWGRRQTISTLALLKLIWPQAPLRTSFNKHSGNQCEKGARQRIPILNFTGRIVDVSIDRLLMDGDEMAFHIIPS